MKCITVAEAAATLGCSRTFLYDALKRGEIPAMRFGTRILILEDDIPAIIATYRVEPLARVSA